MLLYIGLIRPGEIRTAHATVDSGISIKVYRQIGLAAKAVRGGSGLVAQKFFHAAVFSDSLAKSDKSEWYLGIEDWPDKFVLFICPNESFIVVSLALQICCLSYTSFSPFLSPRDLWP